MAEIPVNYEAFAEHLQKENAALRADLAEEKRQSEELSKSFDRTIDREDALRAEVERLKTDIIEENDKLSLAAFRNLKQHLILECDKIAQTYDIRFSSEKKLRTDLAAAVEVERLKTCCVIEAMIANPNVDSLIKQHEADLAAAVEVLREMDKFDFLSTYPGFVFSVLKPARELLARLEVKK